MNRTALIFLAVVLDVLLLAASFQLGVQLSTPPITPTFNTPIPEGEDSTYACYLEAGSKTLDCSDYVTVTRQILARNRCVCAGQQPDEGDDE
jgi:hypothetical protein